MKSKKEKGFTLIEVLVTTSIISLLAAIIFANFDGVREKAASAATQSEAHQIATAVGLSRGSNGSMPIQSSSDYYLQNATAPSGGNTIIESLGDTPQIPTTISLIEDYYYISDGNKAIDANGVHYHCVTSTELESPLGPAVDNGIIAWRDSSMERGNPNDELVLALPHPMLPDSRIPRLSGAAYKAISDDNRDAYGISILGERGYGNVNYIVLWREYVGSNIVYHPLRCLPL